jgi:hypothetical protein
MGTLTNYGPGQLIALGIVAVVAFMFYVYLGFIMPSKKLKDPETENKGFWKLWMFVMASIPMIFLVYRLLKGRASGGNAASNTTGGTPPPVAQAVPQPNIQPSGVVGATVAPLAPPIPPLTALPPAAPVLGMPFNAGNRTKY